MAEKPQDRFVADGHERLQGTIEYRQKVQAIQAGVQARYQEQLRQATFWQRFRLRWQIRREIEAECAALASDEALYFHN
jgi:hypothetical protein